MEQRQTLAARVAEIEPFHVMEVQTAARALEPFRGEFEPWWHHLGTVAWAGWLWTIPAALELWRRRRERLRRRFVSCCGHGGHIARYPSDGQSRGRRHRRTSAA